MSVLVSDGMPFVFPFAVGISQGANVRRTNPG